MSSFVCRVQFLDDTDPFNSTNFPEPTRAPLYTFREDIALINQLAGVHRLLKAPHKVRSHSTSAHKVISMLFISRCSLYIYIYIYEVSCMSLWLF
uniref:FHOD1 N-terminal GTPase-binding domain-containing protein n=2 Tax=Sinocyclocheilus rhinocerous TaxID=307959 RepID=A0A673KXB3_9TELE